MILLYPLTKVLAAMMSMLLAANEITSAQATRARARRLPVAFKFLLPVPHGAGRNR